MNNIDARMVFDNAHNLLNEAFPGLKGRDILQVCKLTQSTYRLEQPLVAGTTNYQFPVLANQQVFSNTEKRLNQQDSAVIYSIGLFAGAPASSVDAAFTLDSYPNPIKYAANAIPLNSLWNGSNLSFTVNNDILLPNWDAWKHFNAPQTQQTAAIGAGSPQDEQNGETGFYPMEPNIIMIGSKNNVINLTLAQGITTVLENSRVIILLRCITAQNSTVVS